tara:strand:+ start:1511 stop:1720 length:210 start_codon:yes stop_codon:yes gene_type:complete
MAKVKTKIAKIPTDVWDDRKKIAKRFGFNSATDGFKITNKILYGDYELKRMKIKGKKKRYVWALEFPDW